MQKRAKQLKQNTRELIPFQLIDTRSETWREYTNILKSFNCDNLEYAYVLGYLAGMIDGKREDRARRAKGKQAQTASKGGAEQ